MYFEKIIIHKHAQERMQERGATEEEVIQTLKKKKNFLQNLVELVLEEIFPLREFGEAKSIKQSKLKFTEL